MKKNILSIFSLCALMGLSGCNAFLELEPLDKVSPDLIIVRMLVLINAVMMV